MKKDTLRLIAFLECNMTCYYCCNENEQFSSQFIKKYLKDINFNDYENICISGGEPFLYPQTIIDILTRIPKHINVYIYTNGTLLDNELISTLGHFSNIKGINIGIHQHFQLDRIPMSTLNHIFGKSVRYHIQDTKVDDTLKKHPELKKYNIHLWTKDVCDMPNEDWVLLKDAPKEIKM